MPEPGARRGWQDSEGNGDRFRFAPPPKVELEESPPPGGRQPPRPGRGLVPLPSELPPLSGMLRLALTFSGGQSCEFPAASRDSPVRCLQKSAFGLKNGKSKIPRPAAAAPCHRSRPPRERRTPPGPPSPQTAGLGSFHHKTVY